MEINGDFPVLIQDCPKFGVIFIITKHGFLYMYEISTVSLIYKSKISEHRCFVSTRNTSTDGMFVINKGGQVFAIDVAKQNLIPYINSLEHIPDNRTLTFKMAQRFNLSRMDEVP